MSAAAMTYAALLVALMAALWAGLLVLAEEAPTLVRALGDPPTAPGQAVPLYRAIEVGRLALLMVAGVSASYAVEWWLRPPLEAALTVVVGVACGVGASIPTSILLVALLQKRNAQKEQKRRQFAAQSPPVVIVTPQAAPQYLQPGNLFPSRISRTVPLDRQ